MKNKLQNAIVLFERPSEKNVSVFNLLAFVMFSAVFFGALTYKLILVPNGPYQEFAAHISFAVRISNEHRIVLPHFLFQLLTIIHHQLFDIFAFPTNQITNSAGSSVNYDWGFAGFAVMLETYIGIELLLLGYLKERFALDSGKSKNAVYFIAFGISICAPIFLLAPIDGKYYLGYLAPSSFYILPTQVLLKLPSLALFLMTPLMFEKTQKSSNKTFAFACLVLLSGLAKPNWLLIMMPGLGIIAVVNFFKRRYLNAKALSATFVVGVAVLSWQYFFKFADTSAPVYQSTIIFTAPFEVLAHYSDFLFVKLVLSIAFPLYVTAAYSNKVSNDFYVKYAWLLFLIGMIYTGFLGESGQAKFAGNFIWCGEIACLMLFVATASLFFSLCLNGQESNKKKAAIGFCLFGAHVVCGLIYYLRSFNHSFM